MQENKNCPYLWTILKEDVTKFIECQDELMFNERDFQIKLGVALMKSGHYDDVEVEYFIPNQHAVSAGYEWVSDIRLDLVVRKGDKYAIVELKYPTKRVVCSITRFNALLDNVEIIKNHGAQDLVMYNFWKDVRRIEIIKKLFPGSVEGGLAVILTNDYYYYKGPKKHTLCYSFSTAENRRGIHGEMKWLSETATTKNNPGFHLEGTYHIKWHESSICGEKFIFTMVAIP